MHGHTAHVLSREAHLIHTACAGKAGALIGDDAGLSLCHTRRLRQRTTMCVIAHAMFSDPGDRDAAVTDHAHRCVSDPRAWAEHQAAECRRRDMDNSTLIRQRERVGLSVNRAVLRVEEGDAVLDAEQLESVRWWCSAPSGHGISPPSVAPELAGRSRRRVLSRFPARAPNAAHWDRSHAGAR